MSCTRSTKTRLLDYLTRAARGFYSNFSEAKSDSQEIKNACKLAERCYEKLEKGDFEDGAALKRFRTTGGGRKSRAPEVRETLFQWFIDVRTSLKARLPKSLFLLKAKKFYDDWLQQHPDTPEEKKFNFQTNGLKAGNWNMEFRYENQKTIFNF